MSRNIEFSIGEYYHIYNRGVEKRAIFLDFLDRERFVKLLYTANSTTPVHLSNYQGLTLIEIPRGDQIVDIGAWCLMPNHFHLLLKEKVENGISLFMQKLLTGYSMYFNTKNRRKGSLFEGTFNAKHLDSDEYLKYQYAYIHLNPISIVDKGWKNKQILNKSTAEKFLQKYAYSSYLDYCGKTRMESAIINLKEFPEYFSTGDDFMLMMEDWINFDKYQG
ncbi:MAG: transposase [Candidatus Paceibacterota bacterium]|jgi:putative transposase